MYKILRYIRQKIIHNKIARDFLMCIRFFSAYIRQKLIHNKFQKIASRWKQEISEARAGQFEAGLSAQRDGGRGQFAGAAQNAAVSANAHS